MSTKHAPSERDDAARQEEEVWTGPLALVGRRRAERYTVVHAPAPGYGDFVIFEDGSYGRWVPEGAVPSSFVAEADGNGSARS